MLHVRCENGERPKKMCADGSVKQKRVPCADGSTPSKGLDFVLMREKERERERERERKREMKRKRERR